MMHGSKLSLTVWLSAAYLMATHSNGIATLQAQLGLGRLGCSTPSCAGCFVPEDISPPTRRL